MEAIEKKLKIIREDNTPVATLVYILGELRKIEVEGTQENIRDIAMALRKDLKMFERELKLMGYKMEDVSEPPANQKIALWIELYRQKYGIDYKITGAEAKQLQKAEVTVESINYFFACQEWWAKDKTINKYVKYYTELKRLYSSQRRKSTGNRQDMAEEFQRRYGNKQ